jgi:tetratricopeptide (TPR) repeat protein
MHFRGNVPYQSPTSFGSTLGSSALSSFLRDTAGPEDFGSYTRTFGPQPYYSATETVTTMAPGRPEVISPMSARLNTRMQQDTRLEGMAAFGADASPMEPMSFAPGTAAGLAVQGPQAQYHLFEDSRLTAEEGLSLSPRITERLTLARVGPGREGEMSAIERFGNRGQGQETVSPAQAAPADSSLGLGLGSAISDPERQQRRPTPDNSLQYPNAAMSIEALRSRFETQVPAESDAEAKQSVTAGYGSSSFNELVPSTNPALQNGSVLQKGASGPGTSQKLLSGQYGDSVRNETANAERGARSTSVPQGGVPLQGGTDQSQRDILERIKQQLEDLTRSVEADLQNVSGDPAQTVKTAAAAKPEAPRLDSRSYMSDLPAAGIRSQIDSSGELSLYMPQRAVPGFGGEAVSALAGEGQGEAGVEFPQTDGVAQRQNETSALDKFKRLSQTDITTEAKRVMGPHTSLESLGIAKFNEHVRAAEEHLRAGRYYRAADCFALASVYKPDDPLALVGRSHALFAAGEYVSSALFLSRALAIYPEYMQMRVDLAGLVGGQEKVAQRLADVEQWYARSGSGQLQLLLSYVYYRTGNLTQARRAVDAAYEKMPELPAVRAVKTAIDGAAR